MIFRFALLTAAFASIASSQPAMAPSIPLTYFLGRGKTPLHIAAAATGPSGDIWVGGVAGGDDLPVVNAYQSRSSAGHCEPFQTCPDLYLARLRADGSGAVFSTYLGGLSADVLADIAVDAESNVYLTGRTDSHSFPFGRELPLDWTLGYRPFVVKMSPSGELVYAYPLPAGTDPRAIAVDARGAAYVGGTTHGHVEPVAGLGLRPREAQLLRSDDGGATWEFRTNGLEDPQFQFGERNLTAVETANGVRLYARGRGTANRSDDGGVSWKPVGPPEASEASYLTGLSAVGDRLAVALDCSVQISGDGGARWVKTFSSPSPDTCIYQVMIAPSDPNTLYASGAKSDLDPLVLFLLRSADGGLSWSEVETSGLDRTVPVRDFVVDPKDPGVLYAAAARALYRSNDGGSHWKRIFEGANRAPIFDPNDPKRMFLVAQVAYPGRLLAFRSSNRGDSWTEVAVKEGVPQGWLVSGAWSTGGRTLYVTTNQGRVLASTDCGVSWNPAGPAVPVYTVVADPVESETVYTLGSSFLEQGFVLKLDPGANRMEYLNLLGGSGQDVVRDLELDAEGRVYAAGETWSPDFPVTAELAGGLPGFHSDAFVAVLGERGDSLDFAALVGGAGEENDTRIALVRDRIVMTGTTASKDFPLIRPIDSQAGDDVEYWIAAVDSQRTGFEYAGYLGRGLANAPPALAADADGTIYVSGSEYESESPGDVHERPFLIRLDEEGVVVGLDRLPAAVMAPAGAGRIVTAARAASGIVGPPPRFGSVAQVSVVAFEPRGAPAPILAAIVNAADQDAHPLTPGTVVTLYGLNLAAETRVPMPEDGRFPTEIAGVQVKIGGRAAPLLYVSPNQINAVTPQDLGEHPLVSVAIESGAAHSNVLTLTEAAASPAIFSLAGETGLRAIVLDPRGNLVSESNPARRGETLTLFATGVGRFVPALVDGEVGPLQPPLPAAADIESLIIRYAEAEIAHAGAAPGESDIYLQTRDGVVGAASKVWVEQ